MKKLISELVLNAVRNRNLKPQIYLNQQHVACDPQSAAGKLARLAINAPVLEANSAAQPFFVNCKVLQPAKLSLYC